MKKKLLQKPEYTAGLVSQSFWFVEFKKYLQLQNAMTALSERFNKLETKIQSSLVLTLRNELLS